MIAQPMRQVSLRKFRTEIADLREPVEVSRRAHDGTIEVLGLWTPYTRPALAPTPILEDQPPVPGGTTAIRDGEYVREERAPGPVLDFPIDDEFPVVEDSEFDRHPRTAPIIITSPDEVATVVRPDPVRAVPKPSQRKRR